MYPLNTGECEQAKQQRRAVVMRVIETLPLRTPGGILGKPLNNNIARAAWIDTQLANSVSR
jgi:hypothetical protein